MFLLNSLNTNLLVHKREMKLYSIQRTKAICENQAPKLYTFRASGCRKVTEIEENNIPKREQDPVSLQFS